MDFMQGIGLLYLSIKPKKDKRGCCWDSPCVLKIEITEYACSIGHLKRFLQVYSNRALYNILHTVQSSEHL